MTIPHQTRHIDRDSRARRNAQVGRGTRTFVPFNKNFPADVQADGACLANQVTCGGTGTGPSGNGGCCQPGHYCVGEGGRDPRCETASNIVAQGDSFGFRANGDEFCAWGQ
jgi:hypothetical protein